MVGEGEVGQRTYGYDRNISWIFLCTGDQKLYGSLFFDLVFFPSIFRLKFIDVFSLFESEAISAEVVILVSGSREAHP